MQLLELPEACLIRVCQQLEPASLLAVQCCCRELRRLSGTRQAWAHQLEQLLGCALQVLGTQAALNKQWYSSTSTADVQTKLPDPAGARRGVSTALQACQLPP